MHLIIECIVSQLADKAGRAGLDGRVPRGVPASQAPGGPDPLGHEKQMGPGKRQSGAN